MNSFNRLHAFTNRQTQRGVSLVELMISITIGLLILSSLTTLFVNQSRTRAELDKSNRMIDNGRYALELLSDNLRVAGFYDNYMPSGAPAATPDPCNLTTIITAATNLDVLRHHVQGYNAATQTSQIASLPARCTPNVAAVPAFTYTAGSATTLKPGSDMLVLRRASTSTVAPNGSSSTVYLQVSNCSTDTSGSYQVAIGGSAAFTAFHDKNCTTVASLRPFLVQVYFVSPDNNVGDRIPTLKRIEFDPTGAWTTTPLVEGIEYMQIDYGLDANADGAADAYCDSTSTTAPCHLFTTADWNNVVSVKLSIIARNTETTTGHNDTKSYVLGSAGPFGPFGDAYKRHAYTQVVRLVNPSSRREVP